MNKLKKENPYIEIYKKRMGSHDFFSPYMKDLIDCFNISSVKCKQFLIDSFTYLDSYFHYLQFLNKDEIDKHLLKAARILQIHPQFPKKGKIFEGLDANEMHKFWMRFFSQFDLKQENKTSESSSAVAYSNVATKLEFLNNITEAAHYFNYKFQIVDLNSLKEIDVKAEIEKWYGLHSLEDISKDISVEPAIFKNNENTNIEKPIDDINYLVNKYDLLHLKQYKKDDKYEEFFKTFKDKAIDIVEYVDNVKKIELFNKKNICSDLAMSTDDFELPNINEVKRCQELCKKIELKRKDNMT